MIVNAEAKRKRPKKTKQKKQKVDVELQGSQCKIAEKKPPSDFFSFSLFVRLARNDPLGSAVEDPEVGERERNQSQRKKRKRSGGGRQQVYRNNVACVRPRKQIF